MNEYNNYILKQMQKIDNSNEISLLELTIFFNKQYRLEENYTDQDRFYVKSDITWEKIRNALRQNSMEIINKGCTLNIPIDGVQLNLQFVLIQDFDKLKAQYFNQNNLIKIFIPNYKFISDYDYNEVIKEAFSHEFKHFLRDIETQAYPKYSYIKNVNNNYSYVNSPSEFEAFEVMLFNFIRYKSNFTDLADKRKWYDLESYEMKKELYKWFIDFVKSIRQNKKVNSIYEFYINHLNEKNLRKLYKDLYEYLFGLVAEKGKENIFSDMPKYISKEKEVLKNVSFNNKMKLESILTTENK